MESIEIIRNNKEFIEYDFEVLKEYISEYYRGIINIIHKIEDSEIDNILENIINILRYMTKEKNIFNLREIITCIIINHFRKYLNIEFTSCQNDNSILLMSNLELDNIRANMLRTSVCSTEIQNIINNWIKVHVIDGLDKSDSEINNIDFSSIIKDVFHLTMEHIKINYNTDELIDLYNNKVNKYYNSFNNEKYLFEFVNYNSYELIYCSSGLTPINIMLKDIEVYGIYNVIDNDTFKIKLITNNGFVTLNNKFELVQDNNYADSNNNNYADSNNNYADSNNHVVRRDIKIYNNQVNISYRINPDRIYTHKFLEDEDEILRIELDKNTKNYNNPSHVIRLKNKAYKEDISSKFILFNIDGIIYITEHVINNFPLERQMKIYRLEPA